MLNKTLISYTTNPNQKKKKNKKANPNMGKEKWPNQGKQNTVFSF